MNEVYVDGWAEEPPVQGLEVRERGLDEAPAVELAGKGKYIEVQADQYWNPPVQNAEFNQIAVAPPIGYEPYRGGPKGGLVGDIGKLYPVGYQRQRYQNPVEKLLQKVSESFGDKSLITGGAAFDAVHNRQRIRNDIDLYTNSARVPKDWIFVEDKTVKQYQDLPEEGILSVKQHFVPEVKKMVDVIVTNGDLLDQVRGFDIDLCKYYLEDGYINRSLVLYPYEVALVKSRKNFTRTVERLMKYHSLTKYPVTYRIDNYEDIFI